MEVDQRRHFINGINPMSVLAIEGSISLTRYTNFSDDLARKAEKCGLVNLGNTCFMNSVLQCLRHTQPLLKFCLELEVDLKAEDDCSIGGKLLFIYVRLMRLISKGPEHIFPLEFASHVTKHLDKFDRGSQQDAQEFLIFILEKMHSDLKFFNSKYKSSTKGIIRKKIHGTKLEHHDENTQITDIFGGTLRSTLKCKKCKFESHKFEPFIDLSIPTPESHQEISLEETIFNFTKQEALTGDNKPMCNNCGSKQKFHKFYKIERFPRILVIHLKRFNDRTQKKTLVRFPLKLDLSKFSYKSGSTSTVYKLYAVSNHNGNFVEGGHYTAFARGHVAGEWFHYNDSRVTRMKEENVVTSDAYLLFYEFMH